MKAISELKSSGNVICLERKPQPPRLTCRDLLDLNEWEGVDCRVEVDRCEELSGLGQFAMIFGGEEPWASWAISREGARVLLWDCVSLADIGRFDTVRDALAAIPGTEAKRVTATLAPNVIPYAALLARRSAA